MSESQHVDVIVIGAGLSGIGAGYRLQTECPERGYLILEARAELGGTWDLFRYPGIRSDSDMFTLGFPFHPWRGAKAIADGPDIRAYLHETAERFDITRHIRFERRVVSASFASETARWTLVVDSPAGRESYTCSFLYLCSGYYRYDRGHAPRFEGQDDFAGTVVHPQHWPADLDHRDKRVVVVGSGATAVTLVPELAKTARHVTMLQRSPSYIIARPGRDAVADFLRAHLPERAAHELVRLKNTLVSQAFYQLARRAPAVARTLIAKGVRAQVPDVDMRHFTPSYAPWDQRLCLVPDGDLFVALREGRAAIATDQIVRFDRDGLVLASGARLDADIIVTATGLEMVAFGGIALDVDGHAVTPRDTWVYRGVMLSGLPNLALCVGYTNASWTLRADLSSRYVCRLLNHMRRHGYDLAVPEVSAQAMVERPLLDIDAGYVRRAKPYLPKQGSVAPWFLRQNYFLDAWTTLTSRVTTGMRFARVRSARE